MRRPLSVTQHVSAQTLLSVIMPIRASLRFDQMECHADDMRALIDSTSRELEAIIRIICPRQVVAPVIAVSDGVANVRLDLDQRGSQDLPGLAGATARDLQSAVLAAVSSAHRELQDTQQGRIVTALARLRSRLPPTAKVTVGEVAIDVDSSLLVGAKAVQTVRPETVSGRINAWSYFHRAEQRVLGDEHPIGRIELHTTQFRRPSSLSISVPLKFKKAVIRAMDEERMVTINVAVARLIESGEVASGGHLLIDLID